MTQLKAQKRVGKRSREVSEKTKETVLKTALHVFARKGFHGAKLREIAELAGTTHSLIRHYFGSKDDLWKAVIDYGFILHETSLRKIQVNRKTSDAVSLFKEFITSYISITARNPDLSKILMHDSSRSRSNLGYIRERQKSLLSIIDPIFDQTKKAGYFKDLDHESFFIYLRALVEAPIFAREMINRMAREDILTSIEINLHTKRVLSFLFHETD